MMKSTRARQGCAPLFLTSLLLLVACGNDHTEPAPVVLIPSPGLEQDAWSQEPAPTELTIVGLQGTAQSQLSRGSFPVPKVDLGALSEDAPWTFRAELRDATGALVMLGLSPALDATVIAGREVPIHCGRVNAFSRPASGLASGWKNPAAGLLLDRYVLIAGEAIGDTPPPSELYDLAAMTPLVGERALPRVPQRIAGSRAGVVLLLDSTGGTLLALTDGSTAEVSAELLGDSLGGAIIQDKQGGSFVVGATRSEGATGAVLHLDAKGALTRLALNQPRYGAAATWIDGKGLVVAGGDKEAPVEILAPDASVFVSSSLLLPATLGAALAPLSNSELVLAGGLAPDLSPRAAQLLSLDCTSNCVTPQEIPFPPAGRGFALGAGKALLLGEDTGGTEASLLERTLDGINVTQVSLKSPRKNASSMDLPDGRILVLGGVNESGAPVRSIEVFTPAP